MTPPRPGDPIPGLYCQPVPEPDLATVAEVDARVARWVAREDVCPPQWRQGLVGFGVGRAVVLQYPDYASMEHLMAAAELLAAENVVDDCYVEDFGGSPEGLGARLVIAQSALDPAHLTGKYQGDWERGIQGDAALRSYRTAMRDFEAIATPLQADRFRHDMGRLHLGYLAEATWKLDGRVPEVWEYLTMRQFNSFRPCLTITDAIAGYELPVEIYALPEVQRAVALACNATTIVNDLYSYTKELAMQHPHLNLPVVLAAETGDHRSAYLRAVTVHNDLMRGFEDTAGHLHGQHPLLDRFLDGLTAWVLGNHRWHQTNTSRYTLPDFWN
ncbi:family 2 encapsulin nanocompartment cargo protein terpene cyclase [Kitasatospora purpeofusca]|uniref:family 2 encapsulin nanocompartment cargo protein terpene cyclase n=1 Tax=Kitasatospora purpeofusca TaxID=67352 RepID=UPI00386F8EA5|nr:family 2 encapsulin nanocompartment cargo protein terpene cyclase [Kitasatospora purpeofusca]